MCKPQGVYPGGDPYVLKKRGSFIATGEFRPPKAGEWYLSGAIIEAYKARADFTTACWIARPLNGNADSV